MGIPILSWIKQPYTATATVNLPEAIEGFNPSFQRLPMRWALQVTGVAADGKTLVTPSTWDVILQPSLDGVAYNDMTSPFMEHKNGTNGNGDVVWGGSNFYPVRQVAVHIKTLTLGSAAKIYLSVIAME